MSDDSNLVSRRTALKGIAGFAGTSAVGAGTVIHASKPVAAVNHEVAIDDMTIELSAEEGEPVGVSEIGISDLWFEVQWENIETSVYAGIAFQNGNTGVSLASLDLGVDGDGTETFGYGQTYEGSYNVDLDGQSYLDGETPMHVSPGKTTNSETFLNKLSLEGSESEKTDEITFRIGLRLAKDDGSIDYGTALDNMESHFDVTVKRVLPDAAAGDGEADAYGESE